MMKKSSNRPYPPNKYLTEPTDQELIVFNKLLKSDNLDAKNAFSEFSASQNKEQFYEKIINLCRHTNRKEVPTAAPMTLAASIVAPVVPVAPVVAAPTVTAPAAAPTTATTTNGTSQNRKENKKVCYLFREGKCSRGNDCKFEHILGQAQDTTVPRRSNPEAPQEKKETKPVCHFFQSGGICRKADRCRYQHPNGVREGNAWKDHKFEAKDTSEKKSEEKKESIKRTNQKVPVDSKALVADSPKKEMELEAVIPGVTVDDAQTSNQIDETGGRSLLQTSDKETFLIAQKNSDLSVNLGSEGAEATTAGVATGGERMRIFEFLVDRNDRPLLPTDNPVVESESLWMALNLTKIDNSFEGFAETEDETLIHPMQRKTNPKKSEGTGEDIKGPQETDVKARDHDRDGNHLFRSDNFRYDAPTGAEEFPLRPMFDPPLGRDNSNDHGQTSHPTDPRLPPNGFPPGPEFPFYPPPPPHMMPPHLAPPFMPPGYHPGMGYPPPPHMMMPPFSQFPGMFPPHMAPYPAPPSDMRGSDGQIHSPNMPPPRMPFPSPYGGGYPFPPQHFGENPQHPFPMPPPHFPEHIARGDGLNYLSPNPSNDQAPAAQPAKAREVESSTQSLGPMNSSSNEILKNYDPNSAIEIPPQETSRFRFGESTSSANDEFPSKATPATTLIDASPVKTHDPKGQVLLSFLRNNTTSPQQSLPTQPTPPPESASRVTNDGAVSVAQTVPERETETATETKEDSTPHQRFYRTTRNQAGRIKVFIQNANHGKASGEPKTEECSIIPGGHMVVAWELPFDLWRESSKSLVIALTRLGSSSNSNNIVNKDLSGSKNCQQKRIRIHPNSPEARGLMNEDKEHDVLQGEITFHAPKAAGSYVYRIFDNSSDEKRCVTVATSSPFVVELRGRDVAINLKFAIEAIGKTKSDIGSLGALRNTFELMRSTGTPFQGRSPQSLIQECVQLVLEAIQKSLPIMNERDEARRAQLLEKKQEAVAETEAETETETEETKTTEVDKNPIWAKARSAQKIHIAAHDCLSALRGNIIAWGMLSPPFRQQVSSHLNQFCQFERRFFDNLNDMYATRSLEFSFIPCPALTTIATSPAARALSSVLKQRLETLMPSSMDFYYRREEVRTRLRNQLCDRHILPSTTDLIVFGSSRNNFGSEGADLDMCLQYGDLATMPSGAEERVAVMEALGAALIEMGMIDVQTRSTARIPIVLFTDPVSGLDCDISFNNPLAIRNTLLLASYSTVDIRVRELAFIVKYWAKQRHINNPQEGTLSSYGYIICLIHFLQMRSPNLLPNLQALPPDWEPNRQPMDNRSSVLPKRWEKHPVEDCYCDTYFFDVSQKRELQKCQVISGNNHQTIGELLIEFFRYFAYEFDFHSHIVSIRSGARAVSKLFKAEMDCWSPHDRLSIEDPFESWYDVAHVIKGTQMSYMRKEFLRAYTLICRSCISDSATLGNLIESDSLPRTVPLAELFDILTAPPTEIPKFANKQARSRANTLVAAAATTTDGDIGGL